MQKERQMIDLGGGVGAVIQLGAEETGGHLALVEHPFAPGGLIEPHVHQHEDEWSYVLEGEIGIEIEGLVSRATAGDLVFKPRGLEHAVWNASRRPARVLELIAPGGFERFFREAAALVSNDGSFDARDFDELAARYGVVMHFDRAPDLIRRYGLQS